LPSAPFCILSTRPHHTPMKTVQSDSYYSYYGSLDPALIVSEAAHFFVKNSDAKHRDIEKTLADFIQITKADYLQEKALKEIPGSAPASVSAWLVIRMTIPTLEYTLMPRWHRDGLMYSSDTEGDVNYKYAITLLGNPTKLLAESDFVRDVVRGIYQERRAEYAEKLSSEPVIEAPRREIVKFSWGQKDSPVHSEPDMNSDRVFISILYGSEREMRNMCELREEPYRD
jgi:hypothetical protein